MKKPFFIFCSLLLTLAGNAQIISTIAGNGIQGYTGDGGIATSAQLFAANGVTIDGSGNIYIADNNGTIRKVTASTGIISTVAGNATSGYSGDGSAATSAALNNPKGLALDASGNIYIADFNNCRIRKVNVSSGIITTVAGNGTAGNSGDGGPATLAKLYCPTSVSIDAGGNIYIADSYNHAIRKVTAGTEIISTVAGNGLRGFTGDGGAATTAQLYLPNGVSIDASGNIYIADRYNNRIRKVTAATGIINTVAGGGTGINIGDGSAATSAVLNYPNGLAIDGSGNIYIADQGTSRIRKVTGATGIITTVAGNGTVGYSGDGGAATSAAINSPTGVVLDASGNIYFSEWNNYRIRKITMTQSDVRTINTDNIRLISGKSFIRAEFDGAAKLELYNLSGIMLKQANASFTVTFDKLNTGLYIVKVNGTATKAVVE